jgi:hypothetical protein
MKDPVRVKLGKLGALRLHGLYDSKLLTANARAGFARRFRDEAVATAAARGEAVTDQELDRRASYLLQHHMALMAYNREQKRGRKKVRKARAARPDTSVLATEVEAGSLPTGREREQWILEKLAAGATQVQLARLLGITPPRIGQIVARAKARTAAQENVTGSGLDSRPVKQVEGSASAAPAR